VIIGTCGILSNTWAQRSIGWKSVGGGAVGASMPSHCSTLKTV
jgi:hypothetical protein